MAAAACNPTGAALRRLRELSAQQTASAHARDMELTAAEAAKPLIEQYGKVIELPQLQHIRGRVVPCGRELFLDYGNAKDKDGPFPRNAEGEKSLERAGERLQAI